MHSFKLSPENQSQLALVELTTSAQDLEFRGKKPGEANKIF